MAEFTGYASTSDMDYSRHVVAPNAFAESIKEKGLKGPQAIKLLFAHKDDKPLGVITKLEQRNRGLWIECIVEEEISYGKDVTVAAKSSGGLSFSVGFYLIDADIVEDANGMEYLYILKGELFEVSVVVFPANAEAMMVAEEKAVDPLDRLQATLAKISLTLANNKSSPTERLSETIHEFKRIMEQ